MTKNGMPLLDLLVYRLLGDGMLWLGKRAWARRDVALYMAMREALRAGHVPGRLKSATKTGS